MEEIVERSPCRAARGVVLARRNGKLLALETIYDDLDVGAFVLDLRHVLRLDELGQHLNHACQPTTDISIAKLLSPSCHALRQRRCTNPARQRAEEL